MIICTAVVESEVRSGFVVDVGGPEKIVICGNGSVMVGGLQLVMMKEVMVRDLGYFSDLQADVEEKPFDLQIFSTIADLAKGHGARSMLDLAHGIPGQWDAPPKNSDHPSHKSTSPIVVAAAIGGVCLLLVVVCCYFCSSKKKPSKPTPTSLPPSPSPSPSSSPSSPPRPQVMTATTPPPPPPSSSSPPQLPVLPGSESGSTLHEITEEINQNLPFSVPRS